MRKRALSALLATACAMGVSQVHASGKSKVSAMLNQLQPSSTSEAAPQGQVQSLFESVSMMQIVDGHVYIDALASGSASALLNDLQGLGLKGGESYKSMVSGRLPLDSIAAMGDLESLQQAWPVLATTSGLVSPVDTDTGIVTSQGDVAQQSDLVKMMGNIYGSGVRVGSLSDSYDCNGGPITAADDLATGDLPEDIIVLADFGCGSVNPPSDEGRAMMQIVHDVAPGASQAFHTAFNGQADFANGIIELQEAGSQVVVDDVIYFAEPMFQDGVIAQAGDTIQRRGASMFSSAGNNARDAWDAPEGFVDSGSTGAFGGRRHDFDPGPGVAPLQRIDFDGPSSVIISFQWDDPAASVSGDRGNTADTDMDLLVYFDAAGTVPFFDGSGISFNIGGDPVELISLSYSGAAPISIWIGLELFDGPEPEYMKYVYFQSTAAGVDDLAFTFPTFTGSLYGHANSYWTYAVGAAAWFRTPYFLPITFPIPSHNGFSSAAGTPILITQGGTPRAVPQIRRKPEFTAPDGGDNTFFGGTLPPGFFDGLPDAPTGIVGDEPNAFPNFFGTSAAAPHAAAAAALLLEVDPTLRPPRIKNLLSARAIDMDDRGTEGFDVGRDVRTGAGFIQVGESVLLAARVGPNAYRVCSDGEEITVPINAISDVIAEGGKLGRCADGGMEPIDE